MGNSTRFAISAANKMLTMAVANDADDADAACASTKNACTKKVLTTPAYMMNALSDCVNTMCSCDHRNVRAKNGLTDSTCTTHDAR